MVFVQGILGTPIPQKIPSRTYLQTRSEPNKRYKDMLKRCSNTSRQRSPDDPKGPSQYTQTVLESYENIPEPYPTRTQPFRKIMQASPKRVPSSQIM